MLRVYRQQHRHLVPTDLASQLESDAPTTTPITFVPKGRTLVTIRYAEPKPFWTYSKRKGWL